MYGSVGATLLDRVLGWIVAGRSGPGLVGDVAALLGRRPVGQRLVEGAGAPR